MKKILSRFTLAEDDAVYSLHLERLEDGTVVLTAIDEVGDDMELRISDDKWASAIEAMRRR